ncbi:di-heme oxidoredictase family protein [Fimbriiglobus ruber]|uniref:Putative thiol oxidoreductase n=1 Tax=Fimbriiglobus ruber TaxID=1908690 RepID=A0A225E003_9BACT|nr:di-heme oxidoredictase family protein [Fimbriiglobus ruber]OWK46872.1 putative thiol oxidoreductase [Fimbriiglobus ruber]
MANISLSRQRRWFTFGVLGLSALGLYWGVFSTGLPVWWGPSASAADISAGRELFEHEWTANDPLAHGDGLGPVFNAKSCVFCHFQGGVGGGGEVAHNAVHFEVFPQPGKNEYLTGVLHNSSVTPDDRESLKKLQTLYPTVASPPPPPPPPGHCGYVPPPRPPFDPIRTQSVQTTALFGAGWIDRISSKAIAANQLRRSAGNAVAEFKLDFDRVAVGRVRVLPDGRVGKFGWKAQFATLEEFVAAACANELGLGTPTSAQAKPIHKSGSPDAAPDLDKKQFRKLVAFVDTLPRPVEVASPLATRGKEVFKSVGCAACHVPDLGGVKGIYSDFLLYTLQDPSGGGFPDYGPEPPAEFSRPDHVPPPQEWKTPPLWGVADSAPYMHDGSAWTLSAAILAHKGDAKDVTERFQKLPAADQTAVIKFLESLKAPPDAAPVKTVASVARK